MTGRILTALRRPSARAAPRFAGRVGSRVDGRAAPRVGSGVDGRAAPRVGSRVPRLLRERPFRRYWAAQTISLFGDQVSGIAIPLVGVLVLHAGPAQMGCLSAIIWLPFLFFGLHAGAWVDRRGHRRATMIVADLGRALLLGSVPVSYALHVLTLWQLYGVAFGAGTLSVLFEVSDSTLFVAVVDADSYVEGNSLVYGSRAMSFVAGPSVGGLLVQALSAPFAVIADALSFIGSAFFCAASGLTSRLRTARARVRWQPGPGSCCARGSCGPLSSLHRPSTCSTSCSSRCSSYTRPGHYKCSQGPWVWSWERVRSAE